jgi:MoCo/4Fe-4S cofactor protein with predicted Tat translocation signal
MEFNNQEVWIGVEDLTNDKAFVEQAKQEFPSNITEALQSDNEGFTANRRDFLKYLGFGVGAATIAASCEIPIKRAIPYVTKPDSIVPGVANYYASSFVNGSDYVSVLVKTKEGRPIKIEGNSLSKVTNGGTSARAQASVLSLYDTNRIQNPGTVKDGAVAKLTWAALDQAVKGKLNAGSQIRIVSHTIMSPTTKAAIADFQKKFPNTKVVVYDPVSSAAILKANETNFGIKAIPNYRFDEADVIVSFGADFLGTWVSPVEFAAQYAKKRKIEVEKPEMSRHIQVESHMSMTGSNADNRILVKPSEQGAAIAALHNAVAAGSNGASITVPALNDKAAKALAKVAQELLAAKGKSLVISNSNNVNEQILVNSINAMLTNYDSTIDFSEANLMRQGDDSDVQTLIDEMNNGSVNAVFVLNANPVFELLGGNGDKFAAGLKKTGLSVSFNQTVDETTANCQYSAPGHHFLESWGDVNPKVGHYSLIQPTITPVFETRQADQSLLTWAEVAPQTEQPMYDYLQAVWKANMFPKQKEYTTFQAFWDATLHDGVFEASENKTKVFAINLNVAAAAAGITQPNPSKDATEITFFETINMANGQYANNPWLQELPDPVTRTVWGNILAIPIEYDGKQFLSANELKDGDKVNVEVGGKTYECVVVRQFGQMKGTVAIGLGYGRDKAGLCNNVGTNVQAAIPVVNGLPQYFATNVKVSGKTGHDDWYACVQHHHTMGVTALENGKQINADEKVLAFQGSLVDRTIIRRSNLKDVKELVKKLEEEREEHKRLNSYTLYRGHQDNYQSGLHWAMHVDLNTCTGCSACTVACMSENNVPVVGKFEVQRHHEMTWLRIDRYFYGDVENPNTVYQPMMCQHCDNAPCENVCPVNATNHSSEGLNQMTYNRCIGTRYCANNCPFKVRRFNWQDYTTADIFPWNERDLMGKTLGFSTAMPYGADNLTRMVLNPDVTVRTRGVIEKCSFCVQRIQEGKLAAKRESRQLTDGDVKTACQSACPTGAITFGNKNDKESAVSKLRKSELNYVVLEEVNVAPNVTYSARVVNKVEKLDA